MQADLSELRGQTGPDSKFQATQSYIVKSCFQKEEKEQEGKVKERYFIIFTLGRDFFKCDKIFKSTPSISVRIFAFLG